jgi:hypothetical protein
VQLEEACASLLADWLRAYGPATETDIRWWTGWPVRQIRSAFTDIEAVAVDLGEDGTGFMLPDDLEDVAPAEPWVALLPSLDTTTMGWKERDWYLGDHYPTLFDRNGNAGPTVWANGGVVGGWTQTGDGEVVVTLLERVDATTRSAIEAERERLLEWLGAVRIRSRFPTPLEQIDSTVPRA